MRFTDIRHDVLPTGRLTVWVPTAHTRARAQSAASDPRRTSHNQEGHITRALARRLDPELLGAVPDPTGAGGKAAPTGWLAVRFDVAPASQHELRRAFELWIKRHETLRSGFRAEVAGTDDPTIERFTLDTDDVTLEAVDYGTFLDPDALSETLEDLFNASTDPVSWPAYVFSAISTPKSTSVVLAFNHLNVDGYSIVLMAQEVRELVDACREHRKANLPSVPSYIDFVEAEREDAQKATSSHDAVERWADFLGDSGSAPEFPLPDGLPPGSQIPQASACLPILTEDEAAAFSRWCRSHGAGATSGFLGAYALACVRQATIDLRSGEARDAARDRFRTLVSTHTRNAPHWALVLGWFTAVAPFDVTIGAGDDLAEALPSIADAWNEARRGAALPLDRVGELLERPIEPRFVISYLDARHAPGCERWQAWRAHAYLGDVGPTDQVYAWINRVPHETYLTWRFPDNETCRREIEGVTRHMQHIVREAISAETHPERTEQEAGLRW